MRHTCDADDLSPPLVWTGVPVETRTFALICDDPDAPRGTWLHWLLWNLPADAVELKEGVPPTPELKSGVRQGLNDGGKVGFAGPCPPPGKPHRYFFRLYALDTPLNIPPGTGRSEIETAMEGHVLARGHPHGNLRPPDRAGVSAMHRFRAALISTLALAACGGQARGPGGTKLPEPDRRRDPARQRRGAGRTGDVHRGRRRDPPRRQRERPQARRARYAHP